MVRSAANVRRSRASTVGTCTGDQRGMAETIPAARTAAAPLHTVLAASKAAAHIRLASRGRKNRLQAAAAARLLAFEGVLDLIGCGPAVVDARHDRYPDCGQRHLNDQLNPVNAWGRGHAQSRGDGGANKCRGDTNQQGEPDRNVLPTRRNDAAQDTDDQADHQRSDDSGYFHSDPPSSWMHHHNASTS